MVLFKLGFIPVTLLDLLDVSVVAYLIYRLHKAFMRSVIMQGLYALFLIFGIWRLVDLLNMNLLKLLLDKFLQIGTLALVVIFAPEIRRMLIISQNTILERFRRQLTQPANDHLDIEEVIGAIEPLAESRTGAILVLVRENELEHIIKSGDMINAAVSKRLIMAIFNKKSPLHDGAVIVKNNQIVAARCVLPVSDDPDLPPELGLRHRSALGITEVSDAAAIVVSEETGRVSVANGGRIKRSLSSEELRQFLKQLYQI